MGVIPLLTGSVNVHFQPGSIARPVWLYSPELRTCMRPAPDSTAPESDTDPDTEPLLTRAEARRAEREIEETLARMAKELVELAPRTLERLSLPDLVLDAVLDTQTIKSSIARTRQLRVVRAALRDSDWSPIRARLTALNKHGAVPASLGTESNSARARAPEWAARLVGEGATALEELLRLAPTADRVHLNNLIRRIRQQSGPRRQRAEEKLAAAIETLLR